MYKFLDIVGVEHLINEIKNRFIQEESGKGLTSNDFTNILKEKLDGIENNANRYIHPDKHNANIIDETIEKQFISKVEKDKLSNVESNAQKNIIELIKRNGSNLPINDKSVDIDVPTKLSQLTNDQTYKTESEIKAMIKDIGRLKREIVEVLPNIDKADKNTLYLIATDKGYSEWFIINNKWEKMGDTSDIDLSGYVKYNDLDSYIEYSDIKVISNSEIDAFLNV